MVLVILLKDHVENGLLDPLDISEVTRVQHYQTTAVDNICN